MFFSFKAEPKSHIVANEVANKNVIASGTPVTIMDVNETLEMVYVRCCSPEYTKQFLGNVLKIHVAHLKAPYFKDLAKVNDMCVARFKKDDIWYRGKIIKEVEPLLYLVRFVDFGTVEQVYWGEIRIYDFGACDEIPFVSQYNFKLKYIPYWSANIKRLLTNVSRNFYNKYNILYNHYGEPIILQPINNSISLNEELRTLQTISNQPLIQYNARDCLIPRTEIMTFLETIKLPSITDML